MDPLRYVVLRHEGVDKPHYDLMFETSPGSSLATWRSPEWPLRAGTPLTYLKDHRPAYLDYEGTISGGRGTVTRVLAGRHRVQQDHPALLIVALEDGRVLRLFRSDHPAQVLGA
jgi:hypothetical protein